MRILEWLIEHVILPGLAVAIALTVRLAIGPLQPGEGMVWVAAAGLAGWTFDGLAHARDAARGWWRRERRVGAAPEPATDT